MSNGHRIQSLINPLAGSEKEEANRSLAARSRSEHEKEKCSYTVTQERELEFYDGNIDFVV